MPQSPSSPFLKRVKRHVAGPEHELFAACAPGFEELCREELARILADGRELSVIPGGVLFSGRLPDLYRVNLFLSVANRVLMRIGRICATSFAELAEKAEKIAWELYLPPGAAPAVQVSCHKCRLGHTDAVAERVSDAVARRMRAVGQGRAAGPGIPQAVYVRGVSDVFELSLDCSGELLHKRGLLGESARAPLRATIASAVLALAGYDPKKPLLDPMSGAGSFCLEAALRVKNIPAGWFRGFAFTGWPAFSPPAFAHLRKKCEEGFLVPASPRVFSSDIDGRAMADLSRLVAQSGLADAVQVSSQDFFLLDPDAAAGGEKGLVAINPPYGRRLSSPAEAEVFFFRLVQRLGEACGGWKAAVLCPRRAWLSMPAGLSWRSGPEVRELRHGGLEVSLVTGELA